MLKYIGNVDKLKGYGFVSQDRNLSFIKDYGYYWIEITYTTLGYIISITCSDSNEIDDFEELDALYDLIVDGLIEKTIDYEEN